MNEKDKINREVADKNKLTAAKNEKIEDKVEDKSGEILDGKSALHVAASRDDLNLIKDIIKEYESGSIAKKSIDMIHAKDKNNYHGNDLPMA